MIDFRCGKCNDQLRADEQYAGRLVRCNRCEHINVCPAPAPKRPDVRTVPRRRLAPRLWGITAALLVLVLVGVVIGLVVIAPVLSLRSLNQHRDSTSAASPSEPTPDGSPLSAPPPRLPTGWLSFADIATIEPPATPRKESLRVARVEALAETREREILEQAAGKLSDAELGREFREINERYFRGTLPAIPVIWEPRLTEVGPLRAPGFTLEGITNGDRILLSASLQPDRRRLRAVLCHEMVHEYFIASGGTNPKHGPAFQSVLHRLSEEGAFEGLWASQSEKVALRSWLDRESARLDGESSDLDRTRDEIALERRDRDGEMDELNARMAAANRKGDGWPSDAEIKSVKARNDLFARRVAEFNARVARGNADADTRFNHQAERYNLMMSYPDGLDEESLIRARSVVPSSRRIPPP